MIETILGFLIMLNPFALFIYLSPIMEDLDNRQFNSVLMKASIISFLIYCVFMIGGEFLFKQVFRIHFESFQVFGGIVIFSYAYQYIVRGDKSLIHIKENLDDLASEIALPFMVGAGSISLSILIGYQHEIYIGVGLLAIILFINFFTILLLKYIKDQLSRRKMKVAFDKNMSIFLRVNGFFIGAIGVDMTVKGIINLLK